MEVTMSEVYFIDDILKDIEMFNDFADEKINRVSVKDIEFFKRISEIQKKFIEIKFDLKVLSNEFKTKIAI